MFTIKDVTGLDVEAMLKGVAEQGYAAIRGLFPKPEIRAAIAAVRAGFDPTRDHPGMGDKPVDVMENFQKVIIGAGAQTNYYVPRFVRVMYNPLWAEDRYGMRATFRRLSQLRNHIQGHRLDYAVDGIEDRLWTAARLQHYPSGGGFFAPHRDAMSGTVTKEAGLRKFIQILVLITERGLDFERGGAYIDTAAGRVDLEAELGSGDVLIYDGRSLHGVADIDPHMKPSLTEPTGRFVALATLYTDMTGDDSQYERYRTRSFPTK